METISEAGPGPLSRAMSLLRLLASAGKHGMSLTDVARQAGMPHGTAHRLLRQLASERLAFQIEESRRYALGPMCYELGVAAYPYDLRPLSRPLLEQLATAADDSAFLSLRSSDESVCIDLQPGPSPIRVVTLEVGTRRPLGAGAGGLAILAALPHDERTEVLGRIAPALETDWGISRAALDASIDHADAEGYTLIRNRVHAGISAIGYPIRNPLGRPMAAVSIAALNSRLTDLHIPAVVGHLKQAALRLEKELARVRSLPWK
jgi:DNA-binding IclR family transcriptional regulator